MGERGRCYQRRPEARNEDTSAQGSGLANTIALPILAAERAKDRQVFGRFHPFGDHLPPQLMRQDDDGLHDGERIIIGPQPPHERLIDLEERNRQLLQIAQGRIARAEIVQTRLNPLRFELLAGPR